MKSFLSIILFFSSLYVFAQDTLYFHTGDKQVVELIAVDKQAGLIYYEIGDKKEVRTINSLKSYSNHSNVENVHLFNNIGRVEPVNTRKNEFSGTSQDPSKYVYSDFSVGVNLLSPFSYIGYEFERSISSNYHQSFYFQYNLSDNFGFRLPIRIGFGQLKDTNYSDNYNYYWQYNRELIFESGLEISIMQGDNQKITPYFLPGIYFGRINGVIDYYDNTTSNTLFYPAPTRTYYRVSFNGGFQFNFSKYVQLNTELGFNLNNSNSYNYVYNNGKLTSYDYTQIGFQAALNLVYRFNGKLRQ